MPSTPLHYPAAYAIHKLHKRFSLPGLIVGSMFPDFEVPAIILLSRTQFTDRLVLHSLFGAAIIGTTLSAIFTVLVYPLLMGIFFKIDLEKVRRKCRLSFTLIFSCFLGNLSHVLLDVVNHLYNPIFWPFQPPILSQICLALGGVENASLIVQAVLIVIFVLLLISQRRNLWEKLLVGE